MTQPTLVASISALSLAVALQACAPDPSATAPQATVGEASAEATTQPAAAGSGDEAAADEGTAAPSATATLTFGAPDSSVGFVGSKVTASHEGSFQRFTGTMNLAEDITQSSFTVEIDTESVVTPNERLTGHLKSEDFFDVATYPTASFVSSAITAGAAEPNTHTVTGNFTLHGVTREISFPAMIAVTDEQVTATSEFSINRTDFGIVYAGMADDLIREGVLIKLSIMASR
jgi:polyisoprenoid-binding protein YceI